MSRLLNKKTELVLLALACVSCLTGCALSQSVNLTDEQNELVAEYAAGKLLQYSKGHENGIEKVKDINFDELNPGYVSPEEEAAALTEEETSNEVIPDIEAEDTQTEEGQGESPAEDELDALVEALEPITDVPQPISASLGEVLGVPEAEIVYDHYDICKTYPNDEDQLAFSMKSSAGKDLLIVHFNLLNPTGSDLSVNTVSDDFKVRISVNGGPKNQGDLTLLENDLMNYSGVLSPGDARDTVFVFEIDEGTEIGTLDLIIIDSESNTHQYRILG